MQTWQAVLVTMAIVAVSVLGIVAIKNGNRFLSNFWFWFPIVAAELLVLSLVWSWGWKFNVTLAIIVIAVVVLYTKAWESVPAVGSINKKTMSAWLGALIMAIALGTVLLLSMDKFQSPRDIVPNDDRTDGRVLRPNDVVINKIYDVTQELPVRIALGRNGAYPLYHGDGIIKYRAVFEDGSVEEGLVGQVRDSNGSLHQKLYLGKRHDCGIVVASWEWVSGNPRISFLAIGDANVRELMKGLPKEGGPISR